MLIQANLTAQNAFKTGGGFRRWIKMACGENPKRTYGIDKKMSPYTRLSSAQHMV
ncbi:hypothetical protein HMI56_000845 [Coelomomyces lativittatus]|nr:hypothetical protein HMI56_000845 [Coelomomyces lativittatus]